MYLKYLASLILLLSNFGNKALSTSPEQIFIHKPILIPHYNHLYFRRQEIEEHLGEYDRYKDLSRKVFIETVNGKSCAVVGSSSNLIDSNYGELIDSHDVVFRINTAPLEKKFAKDVGNKTTVWLINAGVSPKNMNFKLDPNYSNQFFMINDNHPELSKSFSQYFNQIVLWRWTEINTVNKSSEYKIQTPSSGLKALYYAMSLCKKVDAFGFGVDKFGKRGHYYKTNQIFKHLTHNPDEQDKLIQELANQKQINLYMGNAKKAL